MENKSQGSNDVAIDIHRDIDAMLATAGAPLTNKCCIYRVPDRLRKLNEDAYTPKVVSIGPFHHGSPSLQKTEREKQILLRKFIERWGTNLDRLISYVEGLEPEVRNYYAENFTHYKKEELVKIILVDAGFILELFISFALYGLDGDDLLSLNSWLFDDVQEDLLLLENQLPFFVLDAIYTFARPVNIRASLLDLALRMFRPLNLQEVGPEVVEDSGPLHFTDLLRTFHLPPRGPELPDMFRVWLPIKVEHLQSVTELHEAGVKLKVNTQQRRCLLDLKFSGGVLEIPQLTVDDSTEMLFLNMMALEQCHYRFQTYIADYILILDYLINKERDVDLLVRRGIVKSLLGENNDVAKLVNGLGKNICNIYFNSQYHKLSTELNAFGKNSWRITMATLRRRYCNTPWQTAASFAAFFILSFTLIQTVCSLYQVFHGD